MSVASVTAKIEDRTMHPKHDPEREPSQGMQRHQWDTLHTLTSDYLELANEVKVLEAKQQAVKEELSIVMQDVGITAHKIPGVASLTIRPQNTRYVYDFDAMEALIDELLAKNTPFTDALVQRIRECRERKTTKSYLMIMKASRRSE
jgi:hypothetical protein